MVSSNAAIPGRVNVTPISAKMNNINNIYNVNAMSAIIP